MKHDIPRDADGGKLCAWCGEPIRQSGVGRSKDYCRRSCRQRAYEARKQREAVIAAVAAVVARRPDSSRDEMPSPIDTSRDEMEPAGQAAVPAQAEAPPAPDPEPAQPVLPMAWRAMPDGPSIRKRRRLLPPPPGADRPAPEKA